MKRLVAHVSGNVQAVGYRSLVVTMARTLDIKGFIQNLPNGKVFIIAEGPKEDLARFVKSIRIDNSRIKVEDIFTDCKDAKGEFNGFYKMNSRQEIETLRRVASQNQTEGSLPAKGKYLAASSGLEKIDQATEKVNHKLEEIVNDQEDLSDEIESSRDGIEIYRKEAHRHLHSKVDPGGHHGDQLYLFPDSQGKNGRE
jgi:acylphosphatase